MKKLILSEGPSHPLYLVLRSIFFEKVLRGLMIIAVVSIIICGGQSISGQSTEKSGPVQKAKSKSKRKIPVLKSASPDSSRSNPKEDDLETRIEKAIGKKGTPDLDRLHEVEKKYADSGTIKMKVKKQLKMPIMNKTREFSGELFLKNGGKLRLELQEVLKEGKGEKSALVMDGHSIYVLQKPADSNVKPQVLISDGKQMKSQTLLAFLLGKGRLLADFRLEERLPGDHEGESLYLLIPKASDGDIKDLRLGVEDKSQTIKTVSFLDNLDNETRLEFTQVEFKVPLEDNLFKFKIPPGADVTH